MVLLQLQREVASMSDLSRRQAGAYERAMAERK